MHGSSIAMGMGWRVNRKFLLARSVGTLGLLMTLSGCNLPGSRNADAAEDAQSSADDALAKIEDVEQRVSQLESDKTDLEQKIDELQSTLDDHKLNDHE